MVRRPVGPWYWQARNGYYATVCGERKVILKGSETPENERAAREKYRQLEIAARPDPRISQVMEGLKVRPDLIDDVLAILSGAIVSDLKIQPVETPPAKLQPVVNLPDPAPAVTPVGPSLQAIHAALGYTGKSDQAVKGKYCETAFKLGISPKPAAYGWVKFMSTPGISKRTPEEKLAIVSDPEKVRELNTPPPPPTDETTLATLIREFRRVNWNTLLAAIRDERADPCLDQWVDQNQVRESGMDIFQHDIGNADADRWVMYMFGRNSDPVQKRLSRAYRELPDALGIKASSPEQIPAALAGLAGIYPATEK